MGQDDQVGQGQDANKVTPGSDFERLQDRDRRNEVRIFWSEIAVIVFVALAVSAYFIAL